MISQNSFLYDRSKQIFVVTCELIATCGLQKVQCVQSKYYELFSYIISTYVAIATYNVVYNVNSL